MWVCGPPKMNQDFDEGIKQMIQKNLNEHNLKKFSKRQLKCSFADTKPLLIPENITLFGKFFFTWLKPFKKLAFESKKKSKLTFF